MPESGARSVSSWQSYWVVVVVGFAPLMQDLYKFFKVNNVVLVGYGKSENNCKYHEFLFVILMCTIRITK